MIASFFFPGKREKNSTFRALKMPLKPFGRIATTSTAVTGETSKEPHSHEKSWTWIERCSSRLLENAPGSVDFPRRSAVREKSGPHTFLGAVFLDVVFLAAVFFAVVFLAVVFLAVAFLAVVRFTVAFLAVVFLAVAFLATPFSVVVDLPAVVLFVAMAFFVTIDCFTSFGAFTVPRPLFFPGGVPWIRMYLYILQPM